MHITVSDNLTPAQIREKVRAFQTLTEIEPKLYINGYWDDWVNGEEASEKVVDLKEITGEVTRVGNKYIAIEFTEDVVEGTEEEPIVNETIRAFEVKPDLATDFKLIFWDQFGDNPSEDLERLPLPEAFEDVVNAVNENGPTSAKAIADQFNDMTPQAMGGVLRLLADEEYITATPKGKSFVYSVE